ncbi:MAG TPA: ankyrin repeat domain-containing protein [Rickettsia endosymbiont of Ceroptres masudai]|nr:ankyrin repeat domain-containing protein [Rickettsia endosymbiont of Ceroptres masudai]
MAIGILHYWSYLAFYKDITKLDKSSNDYYLDQIITKFRESTIKTEKLCVNDNLFAFRLNDKERIICTVTKYDNEECLVILDILPNHEYHRSKYLKKKDTIELFSHDITIVASSIVNQRSIKNAENKLPELPKICSAHINNKTIIVGKNQLEILEKEVYQPTIFKISGVAGSGKTTIAELLIYKNLNDNKILYVTKSAELVSDIQNRYEQALTNVIVESNQSKNLPQITFSTYLTLCSDLIFKKLFSEDNFKNFNEYVSNKLRVSKEKITQERENPLYQDILEVLSKNNNLCINEKIISTNKLYLPGYLSEKLYDLDKFVAWIHNISCFQKYAGNEKLRIGREIYEDIRKLSDKGFTESTHMTLGKKESYGHAISSEIFKLYTKHLQETGNIDLSLIDRSTKKKFQDNKQDINQYDYIIVDEAQDLRKSELNYIKSLVNKSGSIYFFMDSSQSLLDDFNLTSQYIQELAIESGSIIEKYQLTDAYRMPNNVTELASKVLQIKREVIGGSLSKDEQENIKPVGKIEKELSSSLAGQLLDSNKSLGYIGWLEISDQEAQQTSTANLDLSSALLTNLKSEAARSIALAIIIPDNSILKEVREIFSHGMVFTPEEVKGLEFQKIVLFNFFSGNYQFNYLNNKNTKLPVSDFSKSTNFPKDTVHAKEMGKYSQFFSNLFIAITRSTDSVYFIETNKKTKASLYFKEQIAKYTNKGQEIKLEDSSIGEIIEWIKDNGNKLVSDKLLDYCQMTYDKIEGLIQSLEASTVPNVDNDNATEYLLNIVEVINSIDNTGHLVGNAPLSNNFKKLVERLLKHCKDIDINDTIFSKPLHIDHEIGDSIFDDQKYSDSHLIKIVNKRDQNNKSALDYATQQKHYDLACILLRHGANISSLSAKQQQELLLYSSDITHNFSQRDHELRPIVGLLAIKVPEAVLNYSNDYEYPRLLSYFCVHGTKVIASLLWAIKDQDRKIKILNHGDNHCTPLDRANNSHIKLSDYDHLQIIKYLLEQGATKAANNVNHIYLTLHSAACRGNIETFKYFVNQGDKKDFNTYIGLATIDNQMNIVEYLWQNYRQYTTDSAGNTALHYAAWKGGLASIKYLCENGADVNRTNAAGETPLDNAIEYNNLDVVKYLALEHNARGLSHKGATSSNLHKFLSIQHDDLNDISDRHGNTLLHDAIKLGKMIFINHLIAQDIDINKPNAFGITPLHLAVQNTNDNITKFLLQHSAVYDIPTKDNKTALYLSKYGNTQILKIVHSLFQSSNLSHDLEKMISRFSSYKDAYDPANPMIFLINVRNNQGQTLLHKSIALNDKDATLLILEYNKEYIGINNTIKLAHAKEYVALDVSLQDLQGNTPLHLAARNGNIEIINALISENPDINVKNNLGYTPIFIAGHHGHKNIVKILLTKIHISQNVKVKNVQYKIKDSINAITEELTVEQKNEILDESNALVAAQVSKNIITTVENNVVSMGETQDMTMI